MAGVYYKVKKHKSEPRTYGFGLINRERERDLVDRLTRSSTSPNLVRSARSDGGQAEARRLSLFSAYSWPDPEVLRRKLNASNDEKTETESAAGQSEGPPKVSARPRDLSWMISRLQRPTASSIRKKRGGKESREEEPESKQTSPRSLTSSTFQRPTFSRIAKLSGPCLFCEENPSKAYLCYCSPLKMDERKKQKNAAELQNYIREVVDRVSQPTEVHKRRRQEETEASQTHRHRRLPLISGLEHSRSIDEVVERLYRR